jgi:DNA-binding NarL/FixJ family response regulator
MITVALADDHAVLRGALAGYLAGVAGIEVVGTAGDGQGAVDLVTELHPDIVLMDLQMPGMDGVTATRLIVELGGTDVLVLTSFSDSERIVAALDAGAVGYLLKDAEPEEVVEGLRQVSRGESPIHPRAARQLLGARPPSPSSVNLSPRETEVLVLLRQGLVNKQIARRLGITDRTVKSHLTSVFNRIGVQDRTQAAVWAERHGLGDDAT